MHLQRVVLSDESGDVFSDDVEAEVTSQSRKMPPPVPGKTPMARQKARLIAYSKQSCNSHEGNIYACVIKPEPQHLHRTEDDSSLQDRQTGKFENL